MNNPAARSAERDNIADVSKPAEGTIRTALGHIHESQILAVRRLLAEFNGEESPRYKLRPRWSLSECRLRETNQQGCCYYRLKALKEWRLRPLSQQQ